MKTLSLSILFIFLNFNLLFAQWQPGLRNDFDTTLAARLQFMLDSMRSAENLVGVSASVIIPNHGTWVGTSGISHDSVNITPGMYFCIASNTKTFIAVLMLRLAELNFLSLDDSLDQWLPNYNYIDSTITIRQLLNHTSGIFNFTSHPGFMNAINSNPNRYWTPPEIIMNFVSQPYFTPGQGMAYSNTNYILAGMIIKEATDTTVSWNLRQLVLSNVNLDNVFLPPEELWRDTIPHEWEYGIDYSSIPRTSRYSAVWTAGAMFSTAENTAKFYQKLFGLQIINQASLDQMLNFTPQSSNAYGLGIRREVLSDRVKYCHSGSYIGFESWIGIDSALGYSISVLVNQRPYLPFRIARKMDIEILNNWPIAIVKITEPIPEAFLLQQNYPNPFNPVTKIKFGIPLSRGVDAEGGRGVFAKLYVYDILGREVAVLVNERLSPGTYQINFDGTNYPSGVYFYTLRTGDFTETKKMILIK